ncbi:MAG: hypothetical protein HQL95_08245 [Magnetococcales bacterium]|nr:hypothetical protein [Magnetococcales bacterium]
MSTAHVARILQRLDRKTTDRLLAHLEQASAELARAVRDDMVLFEDLTGMDDRGMQILLREVPAELLAVALRGADEKMVRCFSRNLSRQGAAELQESRLMGASLPVKQVESARRSILETARDLDARGLLILPSRAEPLLY